MINVYLLSLYLYLPPLPLGVHSSSPTSEGGMPPIHFRYRRSSSLNFSGYRPIRFFSSPTSRSEEHTSELQSLMRISYAVFCLKKKIQMIYQYNHRSNCNKQTTQVHNLMHNTQ